MGILVFINTGNCLTELIYKEVMNSEEKTKNGVVKGQPSPSGTHSQWITSKIILPFTSDLEDQLQLRTLVIKHVNKYH